MKKAALIEKNTQLQQTIDRLQADFSRLEIQNTQLQQENDVLRSQIKCLKQQLFGSGKSEVIASNQLELALSGLNEASESVAQSNPPKQDPPKQKTNQSDNSSTGTRRYQLPDHLEVQETIIDPEEVVANPEAYRQIDQEVTEELDIIPPEFIKRRTIRRKFVSRQDKGQPPVIAPALKRPIDRGIAAVGLLVYIIISKYCDHLPLYRQEAPQGECSVG